MRASAAELMAPGFRLKGRAGRPAAWPALSLRPLPRPAWARPVHSPPARGGCGPSSHRSRSTPESEFERREHGQAGKAPRLTRRGSPLCNDRSVNNRVPTLRNLSGAHKLPRLEDDGLGIRSRLPSQRSFQRRLRHRPRLRGLFVSQDVGRTRLAGRRPDKRVGHWPIFCFCGTDDGAA